MLKKISEKCGYYIDRKGNIYNNKKIALKGQIRAGYKCVMLSRKTYNVHNLVAKYFIPNSDKKPLVLHKDGNKLNNHYKNLYWGTYSDNAKDAIRHGTFQGLYNNGDKNGRAKYNMKQRQLWVRLVREFKMKQKDVAKLFNISEGHLSYILNTMYA